MRAPTARYIVGIPSERILYDGDHRLTAWLCWLVHWRSGAQAFDRRSWILDPASWLRHATPESQYFLPQSQKAPG